jgi:hypothetical protein
VAAERHYLPAMVDLGAMLYSEHRTIDSEQHHTATGWFEEVSYGPLTPRDHHKKSSVRDIVVGHQREIVS